MPLMDLTEEEQEAIQRIRNGSSCQWPTPLSHRMPCAADGDEDGNVQVLFDHGWIVQHWADVIEPRWQHTPGWQPKAPEDPLKRLEQIQQMIDDLRHSLLEAA